MLLNSNKFSFMGMGVAVGSRAIFGLWVGLVFCVGLFFGCVWDGWCCFFVCVCA